MWMFAWCYSRFPLNSSHLFFFLFVSLFLFLFGYPIFQISDHYSSSSNMWLISSSVLLFQLLYSLALIVSFLYFLSLCWHTDCVHLFFFQVWWASLWPMLWTLYQVNCLSVFYLVFFWGFVSFIVLERIFLMPRFARISVSVCEVYQFHLLIPKE